MAEKDFLEAFGFLMAQEFAQSAPKKTALLARSFPGTVRVENGKIKYSLPRYAQFVEFGTRPYVITPKTAGALYWDGAKHPVKQVNHPGITPNPFMRDTFNRQTEKILKQTINLLNK